MKPLPPEALAAWRAALGDEQVVVDPPALQRAGTATFATHAGVAALLRPAGTAANVARRNFARLLATGAVDLAFDAAAGGVPTAVVNALALQPDGRVLAVGQFSDLGGSRVDGRGTGLPLSAVRVRWINSATDRQQIPLERHAQGGTVG